MRSERFFRWVWRVNGLLLLPLVLVSLFGVGAMLTDGFGWMTREPDERGAIRTGGEGSDARPAERLRLSDFQSVQGTPTLRAALHSDGDADWSFSSSGSYLPRETRNFLFYDTATRDGRWLVEGNQRLFLRSEELGATGCPKEGKTTAIVYLVAERDTDDDARVSSDDDLSVAVSAPDGRGYQVVLDGVDAVHGWHFEPPSRLVVFHAVDGAPRVFEFDLEKRAMLENKPLARPR